jgi:hypothetical protein
VFFKSLDKYPAIEANKVELPLALPKKYKQKSTSQISYIFVLAPQKSTLKPGIQPIFMLFIKLDKKNIIMSIQKH